MNKQYDHIAAQTWAREFWQTHNTYALPAGTTSTYTIDTPPPTVSGSLHIGHIFSYTQTDIIARYKRMSGYKVFYPFGFDDNGLATERFVEKKRGIQSYDLSRSEFIRICLEETALAEQQFENLWKNIGLSVDWNLHYSTISAQTRKISQLSFIELYKKGYVYRQAEPAIYCTTCRTTVAQAELEDVEKASTFNDIVFMCGKEKLLIGTTRPELLPSCVAVFYHPSDIRYTHLAGKQATVPLYNYEVPLLADDAVDPEKGTGLVMCCTFGDKTDIMWYKKYKLPFRQSINLDGKWAESTGPLAGMRVFSAREKIIQLLEENGLLVNKKPIMHSVNVHERCKKEVEYLILTQWFLRLLPYKETFLKLADTIEWNPTFMKSRYINWVENLNWDWCLSRQRSFGIPFPVWHCRSCQGILLPEASQLPIDPQEQSYQGACSCGKSDIVADTDVMDTWNTSSITPYILFGLTHPVEGDFFSTAGKEFLPMNMRPQAHDIIRTWAFYTIVKAWMHNETIPWKSIVISGHVLSTEKEKISKSQGNSPLAPETLLATSPADAIRYWTASGNLGHDIAFSQSQLAIGQKLLVKLWNAFRFAEPYLADFTPQNTPASFQPVNEWVLDKLSHCFNTYQQRLDTNEFGQALASVESFFWHTFCDNYLELIKDQLMHQENYSAEQLYETKWTLYTCLIRLLQLYAPYLPFICEILYDAMYKRTVHTASIHLTQFTDHQTPFVFEHSRKLIDDVVDLIGKIRKLKSEQHLSLKTELVHLTIAGQSQKQVDAFKPVEALIRGITQSRTISYEVTDKVKNKLYQQDEQWLGSIYLDVA